MNAESVLERKRLELSAPGGSRISVAEAETVEASHLAMAESKRGDYERALGHMELWRQHSPNPEAVEKLIEELRQQQAGSRKEP